MEVDDDKHFMRQAKRLINTSIDDVRQNIESEKSKHVIMAAIAMERNSKTSRVTLIKLLQSRYRKLEKEEKACLQ
jgi:hypothetical protein